MNRVFVPILASVCLSIAGCGGSSDTATTDAAVTKVDLSVSAPANGSTVATGSRTIRGTSTPGAKVTVAGDVVLADSTGAWARKIKLDPGASNYPIVAEKDGLEFASVDYRLTLKQSPAQIAAARRAETARLAAVARRKRAVAARAAARRRAAAQRRREAAQRRRIAAEAQYQRDLRAAINGSTKKMSGRVAREITNLCSTGAVSNFDVCFEAGYKTGGDVAEKYATP